MISCQNRGHSSKIHKRNFHTRMKNCRVVIYIVFFLDYYSASSMEKKVTVLMCVPERCYKEVGHFQFNFVPNKRG